MESLTMVEIGHILDRSFGVDLKFNSGWPALLALARVYFILNLIDWNCYDTLLSMAYPELNSPMSS
jgi:hypothetical protein